ncbi:MAG: glucose 1-dehydrogenase [Catalinimonas sp.]
MGRVDNKIFIVTGAGRGIGRACADLLAREGALVYVTDCEVEPARTVAGHICDEGGWAEYQALDVRDEAAWEALIRRVVQDRGRIDGLVNNAGIFLIEQMTDTTIEQVRELYETNVYGTWLGMKHAAPALAAAGGGAIVNLASMDATDGASGFTVYGGTKGAVDTMTRDAALELAKQAVRVNSVHPGHIRTQMAAYGARQEGITWESMAEESPLGRIGDPLDVAWGVLYLLSDEARWVTGIQLRIDGGATAGKLARRVFL